MTPQLIAGVSGGRTSALMALHYVPRDTVFCFQNTGREHSKTLEFLLRLEEDLRRPIVRLEFRAPARGERPGLATFEIVSHEHLSRRGEPFIDLLECMAAFRKKEKGKGPVAPWARQRVCTAYLKIKTQRKFIAAMGWTDPTLYVGLRADEPSRVAKMRERNDARNGDEQAPLDAAGVVKADVLKFWASKPYDLDLPEHLGNCTACFLKDEADLASALLDHETDPEWWIAIEQKYAPMRRGRSSYLQVFEEAPARMRIRSALATGAEPPIAFDDARRQRLVVAQETERLRQQSSFSCHCEGAENMNDEELLGEVA